MTLASWEPWPGSPIENRDFGYTSVLVTLLLWLQVTSKYSSPSLGPRLADPGLGHRH